MLRDGGDGFGDGNWDGEEGSSAPRYLDADGDGRGIHFTYSGMGGDIPSVYGDGFGDGDGDGESCWGVRHPPFNSSENCIEGLMLVVHLIGE